MKEAETFFTVLRNSLPRECEEYWRNFAAPNPSQINAIPYQSALRSAFNHPTEAETRQGMSNEDGHDRNLDPHSSDGHIQSTRQQQTNTWTVNNNNAVNNLKNHSDSGQGARDVEQLASDELQEAQETGVCFPGRRSVRPSIVFRVKDALNCSKQYKTSKTHSPGLLTVQSACDAPKLIGFVIMTQAESTALALTSILTHFGVPPRSVFYDNSCNLFISFMLRVPWLLGRTRLTVDRFHYKSHKCCSYINPDSFRQFDMQRTETADSINARIEKSLTSIRYLNGDNLMSFLRVRFSLLNRADTQDEDLTYFFNNLLPCACGNCSRIHFLSESKEVAANNEDIALRFQV